MALRIDEVADDIFRLNLEIAGRSISYSFFLVRDEAPTLVETGFRAAFPEALEAVATLVDVSLIRYIVVPHLEADECGALNDFLAVAPHAVPMCSPIGKSSLTDLAQRAPAVVDEQESYDLGQHRLRFLLTPYVHQWDSLMAFDETARVLFSSDLFIERGVGSPTTTTDLSEAMVETYRASGILPSRAHLDSVLDKVEQADPTVLACHHGTVKLGNVTAYLRALRAAEVTGIVNTGSQMNEPTVRR